MPKRGAAFRFLVVAVLVSAVSASAQAELKIESRQLQDGSYLTTGSLPIGRSFSALRSVLAAPDNYRDWALWGQDGNDPLSASFIGTLTGINFHPEGSILDLVYDVRLIWPFGSQGNVARFNLQTVDSVNDLGANLFTLGLFLADESFALEKTDLRIYARQGQNATVAELEFRLSVKFSWLLQSFFPMERYRSVIERRVRIFFEALDYHVEATTWDEPAYR